MLMFLPVMFSFFFVSPRVLWAPSTDRPETLPHDRKPAEFYNPTPKSRGRSPPQKKWVQKHAKFRSILYHFRLWSRMSPAWGNKSKIGKRYKLGKFLLRLTKKVRWIIVHQLTVITHMWLWTQNALFWDTISRPLGGTAPWNFYMR